MIRVRFAPSPTGYLHVGGARTALFNYLFARHHHGRFILRIEDTDRGRYDPRALEEIYASLNWLGLDWDEGQGKPGEFGPYVQSERLELYRDYAGRLLQTDRAYRCFCSPERLDELRRSSELQPGQSAAGGYDRHCRNLAAGETERLLKTGRSHVIRLKIPATGTVSFNDLIRGEITYRNELLDDLVLLKSDGFPTYHLANVVDDHLMQVSHILRGDEWIASTPKHMHIYQALGWEPPYFAHLPVILSPDGGKLSKRKGAASVLDYQKSGILPEVLFNFLALLGWSPGDDREILTRAEMVSAFDLEKVNPKAAVFDEQKLDWMNGQYLASMDNRKLVETMTGFWSAGKSAGLAARAEPEYLQKVVELLKQRAKRLPELAEKADYFFQDPLEYETKAADKHFRCRSLPLLTDLCRRLADLSEFTAAELERVVRESAAGLEVSAGALIHPVRLALSGISAGPGLFEMMEVLGPVTVLRRLEKARQLIEEAEPTGEEQ